MDSVDSETDRQNVLIQTTQNIVAHVRPRTALRLPAIYLPRNDETPDEKNGLVEVLGDLERVIGTTVQRNMETVRADADKLAKQLQAIRKTEMARHDRNFANAIKASVALALNVLVLVLLGAFFAAELGLTTNRAMLPTLLHPIVDYVERAARWLPDEHNSLLLAGGLGFVVLAYLLSRWLWRPLNVLQTSDITRAMAALETCSTISKEAALMYDEYLNVSLSVQDRS